MTRCLIRNPYKNLQRLLSKSFKVSPAFPAVRKPFFLCLKAWVCSFSMLSAVVCGRHAAFRWHPVPCQCASIPEKEKKKRGAENSTHGGFSAPRRWLSGGFTEDCPQRFRLTSYRCQGSRRAQSRQIPARRRRRRGQVRWKSVRNGPQNTLRATYVCPLAGVR